LNPLDLELVQFLNAFAQRSSALDKAVDLVANGVIVKGTLVALGVWIPWQEAGERGPARRAAVVATLWACLAGIAVSLLLQKFGPHRILPVQEPSLGFVLPAGQVLPRDWPSSFPSDHGIMFGALAAGAFAISRRLGLVLSAYTLLLVFLPRVYLGYHYPTDLLAGAAIGAGLVALAQRPAVREALARAPLRWHARHPATVNALLFLLTIQIATVFFEARTILGVIAKNLVHLR